MGELTRSDLLAKGKPKVKRLECAVDGFGGDVFHVARLSGKGRDWWDIWRTANVWSPDDEKAGKGKAYRYKPGALFRPTFVALTLCDAEGALFFDVGKPSDVQDVAALDGDLLDWLEDEAMAWNGLRKADAEEAEKNSPSGASGGTGSGSPPNAESA